ncbi:MAG: transposase, partial [Desulfobacteraceae bacterium]
MGEILDSEMQLSEAGKIVADEWAKTAQIRHEVELDTFIVMPNHFHAVVWISARRGDRPVAPTHAVLPAGPRAKSIGSLMAGFKSAVTKRVNEYQNTAGLPFWQRNYYEHVI